MAEEDKGTEAGTAYVSILPSGRGFARKLREEIAKEFADAKVDQMVAAALGNRPLRIPVEVDSVKVSADADTSRLRSELAAQVDQVGRQVTAEVDTEPAAPQGYAVKLRQLVNQVAGRVTAKVDVEPRVDQDVFRRRLTQGLTGTVGALGSAGAAVAGIAGSMVASLGGVAGALFGVVAAAGAVVPAVGLVGGALAALPGIATGAAAAIGSLAIGMLGISERFDDAGAAGGGAGASLAAQARQVAQATRGVEAAERSLARAQRDVVAAQEAVTRARAAEVERLEDLDRAARGARLGEEEAAQRVADAEKDLADARHLVTKAERDLAAAQAGGNYAEIAAAEEALTEARRDAPDLIRRADLAYRRAVLGLEDARDATQDLAVEQAHAAKVGVEGSDQVRDALERQRAALEGVTAAQEQLLSAREALAAANERQGAGGIADELTAIAPAAQEFVDAVKELKPAWEALRLDVQQRLFAGLGDEVRQLASAWLPQARKTLGDYADTFNRLAKRAADSVSQRSFIDNMAAGAESSRKALERVGDAVSGPLTDAFGRLSRAAGPFVETIGDELAELLEDFSSFVERADESGDLDKFFTEAGNVFGDLLDIVRDLASIGGSVVEIFFGERDTTATPWEGLRDAIDGVAEWLRDPDNQQKVRDFLSEVKAFFTEDLPAAAAKGKETVDVVVEFIDDLKQFKQTVTDVKDSVLSAFRIMGGGGYQLYESLYKDFGKIKSGASQRFGELVDLAKGIPGRITSAVGNLGTLLYRAGQDLIGGLVDGIRSMFGWLESNLDWVTERIPDWKGPPEKDRRLLEPAGQSIMQGLIRGIGSQIPALRSELGGVTDLVAATPLASPAAGFGATPTPSPAAARVEFVGDAPDSFMRWMRDNVRIYYGGDPAAAMGS